MEFGPQTVRAHHSVNGLRNDAALYFSMHCIKVPNTLHVSFFSARSIQCSRECSSAQRGVDVRNQASDDVKLAHKSPFSPAALVKPLPFGCGGEDATVLAAASVWLQGDLCLPVLEAHAGA